MTEQDFNKLYRDARLRKRIRFVCLKWWRGNQGTWKVAKSPAFCIEDLEQEAWARIWEKAEPGKSGSYYERVASNRLYDLFEVAKARQFKVPNCPESSVYFEIEGKIVSMTELLYGKAEEDDESMG